MPRIVWIDDNPDVYQQVADAWVSHGLSNYTLEYYPFPDETEPPLLPALQAAPPDILLLDWNEGRGKHYYSPLNGIVPTILFVSWSPQDTLRVEGLFGEFPELLDKTITKPFSAAQLAALIQFLAPADRRVSAPSLLDDIAIRYLNKDLLPFSNTRAWKLDVNRPELVWSENNKNKLANDGYAKHSLFCAHPTDPDKFGPVQFLTKKIPEELLASCPTDALYYQSAFELPQEGPGLEEFGASIMGIIHMMRQAGFVRGRYYKLVDIPGLPNLALELVVVSPPSEGKLPLPVSRELDTEEIKTFSMFCDLHDAKRDNKDHKDDVIFKFIPPDKNFIGENTKFWNQYIEIDHVDLRLELPIYLTRKEMGLKGSGRDSKLSNLHGVFIFDTGVNSNLPEDVLTKRVKALEPSLLIAINYLQVARKAEEIQLESRKMELLLNLHKKLIARKTLNDIEMDIAFDAINLVAMQNDRNGYSVPIRSAMFLKYDKFLNILRVTCDTDNLLDNTEFPLVNETFASVKCALRFLKEGSSDASCIPDFDQEPETGTKVAAVKDFLNCNDESLLQRIEFSLKNNIKAIISFPVHSSGELLGILTIRSNHRYEFSSNNVQTIIDMLTNAAPHLERKRIDENRKMWDGLVMHEMRANLSLALNKLAMIEDEETLDGIRKRVNHLQHVLKDGVELSSAFLDWLKDGKIEKKETALTNDSFWHELEGYGKYRQDVSEWLKWHWSKPNNIVCKYPTFLGRVLRILIDNAFRYAGRNEGSEVVCNISIDMGKINRIRVEIANPGVVAEDGVRYFAKPSLINPPIDKAGIGLTLVHMMCNEVGGELIRPRNMKIANLAAVVTTLFWPLNQEMEHVRE